MTPCSPLSKYVRSHVARAVGAVVLTSTGAFLLPRIPQTDGVFPAVAGVQVRTVVHVRHASQHQIVVRLRNIRNIRAVMPTVGSRLFPGRLRASLPAGGYTVERWTFSSDGVSELAVRAAMAAWLHAHVFGPGALWSIIEAVRVERTSAHVHRHAQAMV